jgi:hypothetical protein
MKNTKSANCVGLECKTNIMSNVSGIQSDSAICDIFNMPRGSSEIDIVSKLSLVWSYGSNEKAGIWYVALMFYMRSIRKLYDLPKGKGEKLISYYMILWLLSNHRHMFMNNYFSFIRDMGCYKDCLHLAKLAKEKQYSDYDIRLLLVPMAVSLIEDEKLIIHAYLNKIKTKQNLSLASKWAPREGKAFTMLIPYLKQLCNITGKNSNVKWRKYIQMFVFENNNELTIETLLSTKQYNKVNFETVPLKAFDLYKNTFSRTAELNIKYTNYLNRIKTDERNIAFLYGFDPCNIDNFLSTNSLETNECPIQIIKKYLPLVDFS